MVRPQSSAVITATCMRSAAPIHPPLGCLDGGSSLVRESPRLERPLDRGEDLAVHPRERRMDQDNEAPSVERQIRTRGARPSPST
jgi:hypothetical protein